jgi:hypothetical protein
MKTRIISCLLLFILFPVACTSSSAGRYRESISLATFTESDVEVSVHLDSNSSGEHFLSATFTPLDGYHMYSKDIPIIGVDGLGRPTLIELTAESQMKSVGGLIESVRAEVPDFEPKELLVYPPGAVTLSLHVELPPGNEWVEDVVKVTYMSCNENGCKAPVVGKLVSVRIPGADMSIMGDENE